MLFGFEADVLGRLRRVRPENDGRLARGGGLLDRLDDVRLDELAAVGEHRVEARHLERRDEHVALADAELHGVARRPDLVDLGLEVAAPPGGRRDESLLFGTDVDPGRRAEAHRPRPLLERRVRAVVEAQGDLVEVGVAGGGERGGQRHRLVRVRIPVREGLPVDDLLRRALDELRRREDARLERGKGGHRLEGRARRIEAGHGAVERRVVGRRVGELRQVLLGHPARVDARVERGVGGESEDLAGLRIHRDERAAVRRPLAVVVRQPDAVGQGVLGRLLQIGVDCQADVVAGLGELLELTGARHASERVDEDAPDPRQAAKVRVVGRLHPGLADAVARGVAALPVRRIELLLGDLAHVAERLRRDPAIVVVALVGLVDLDAGEVVLVLEEVVDLVLLDVLLDRDRRQEVTLPRGDVGPDVSVWDVQERREAPHDECLALRGRLLEGGRPQLHRRARLVGDEHDAVPVEDRAARGRRAERAHLVVLRHLEVALSGDDLQRPQAEEERAEDRHRNDAEDRDPDRGLRRDPVGLLHPRVGREKAAREVGARTRQPGSPPGARAARPGRSGGRARRADRRAEGSARGSGGASR